MVNPTPANPATVAPDHLATERALIGSGLDWTLLRNNVYAELMLGAAAQAAKLGQLVTNTGDGATAYVSREDCAAVAAAVLADGGHESATFDITGPEALTATDLAALASKRAGEQIPVHQLDDAAYTAELVGAGLPEPAARLYASIGTAARQGLLATVTKAVAQLSGQPPRTLHDLLAAAYVQPARPLTSGEPMTSLTTDPEPRAIAPRVRRPARLRGAGW